MAKQKELPDIFKDMAKNVIRPPILYGCGYRENEMRKPMIGIANTQGSRKNNFTFLALRFRLGLVDFKEQKAQ